MKRTFFTAILILCGQFLLGSSPDQKELEKSVLELCKELKIDNVEIASLQNAFSQNGFVSKKTFNEEFFKIIGLGVLAAVTYGILQDQITARLSIEYFTSQAHPNHYSLSKEMGFSNESSPTLVAFFWGVVATWWVGLPLGTLSALAARLGDKNKLDASHLIKPLAAILAAMGSMAALAGLHGYSQYKKGNVKAYHLMHIYVPQEKHGRFIANGYAHNAAYVAGAFGGLALIGWIVYNRFFSELEKEEDLLGEEKKQRI